MEEQTAQNPIDDLLDQFGYEDEASLRNDLGRLKNLKHEPPEAIRMACDMDAGFKALLDTFGFDPLDVPGSCAKVKKIERQITDHLRANRQPTGKVISARGADDLKAAASKILNG